MDSFICLVWEDWQDTAIQLVTFSFFFFSWVQHLSSNMTSAGLFWESLNYKMSVWDIRLFFWLRNCSFTFPGLKILDTEHFVLQDQMTVTQKERSEGNLRPEAQRAGGECAGRLCGCGEHDWGPYSASTTFEIPALGDLQSGTCLQTAGRSWYPCPSWGSSVRIAES